MGEERRSAKCPVCLGTVPIFRTVAFSRGKVIMVDLFAVHGKKDHGPATRFARRFIGFSALPWRYFSVCTGSETRVSSP